MSPLYQLFSSALPRKIVGTLGTIKVLLPSYPVNKCILLHRCQWNIEKFKSLFYQGKKKVHFTVTSKHQRPHNRKYHRDWNGRRLSKLCLSLWSFWTIKKLLPRNSLQNFYTIFLIERTVLNVKTDIITTIAENPIGRTAILVIMYVDTIKSAVIVFISNLICLTSHHRQTDNFQYQSQFIDTDNITLWDQRKNVCFVDHCLSFWSLCCLSFFDIRILIYPFGIFKLFLPIIMI